MHSRLQIASLAPALSVCVLNVQAWWTCARWGHQGSLCCPWRASTPTQRQTTTGAQARPAAAALSSWDRFFADAHADVWRLHAAGPLPLSSTGTSGLGDSGSNGSNSSRAGDDADFELQAVVEDSCHPRITCARETSLCSSISDVCGIAARVCSHGVPLLGCAVSMPAPERFLFYDLILSHLLKVVHVQLMYLDTACSYGSHWRHYMPQDAGPSAIKVGWWHARGHGASCFMKNSGLYLPGEALYQAVCCLSYVGRSSVPNHTAARCQHVALLFALQVQGGGWVRTASSCGRRCVPSSSSRATWPSRPTTPAWTTRCCLLRTASWTALWNP